jgi:inner membrane protein
VDNLTHTLIGLLAGEAVYRGSRPREGGLPDPVRRTALLATGIAGGNLPDVDLLWSMPAFTGDSVTYLVEHRGYTHTLVGCAALALLLFLGALAVLRWRGHAIRAPDARLLGAMSLLAVLLHLGMDALNEYGVHPFWPWDNRWYYGDAVFIIEPLCWLALAPLYFSLRSRAARVFLGFVLLAGCLAVLVFHRFAATWWALPAVALLLVAAGRRLSRGAAAVAAACLLSSVIGLFALARASAAGRVQAMAAVSFPAASTLDIVLSPAPAHPLCWDVMLLQQEGRAYVARLGQLSLAAQIAGRPAANSCARSVGGPGTAVLQPVRTGTLAGMHWTGEFTMDAGELVRLAHANCNTRRVASFLRAPFATETDRGWVLGDLRFDREPGAGFAEVRVDYRQGQRCGRASPWTPPRRDLGF